LKIGCSRTSAGLKTPREKLSVPARHYAWHTILGQTRA
jgi:hypothetical protein